MRTLKMVIAALKAMNEAKYPLEYCIQQLEAYQRGLRGGDICDAIANNMPMVLEPDLEAEMEADMELAIADMRSSGEDWTEQDGYHGS